MESPAPKTFTDPFGAFTSDGAVVTEDSPKEDLKKKMESLQKDSPKPKEKPVKEIPEPKEKAMKESPAKKEKKEKKEKPKPKEKASIKQLEKTRYAVNILFRAIRNVIHARLERIFRTYHRNWSKSKLASLSKEKAPKESPAPKVESKPERDSSYYSATSEPPIDDAQPKFYSQTGEGFQMGGKSKEQAPKVVKEKPEPAKTEEPKTAKEKSPKSAKGAQKEKPKAATKETAKEVAPEKPTPPAASEKLTSPVRPPTTSPVGLKEEQPCCAACNIM